MEGPDERLCNGTVRLSVIGCRSRALCRSNRDCGGEMLSKAYLAKYALLSISPPQSRFERHNALERQPITERRTVPLHRRSSGPSICLRRRYLGLGLTTCAPREC